MSNKNIVLAALIIVLSMSFSFSQTHQVRIGFLGNSITIGSGLSSPQSQCYPSQVALLLQEKYGDTCVVENFAVSGRTMLKNGDFPLWDEPLFEKGWNYAPDIVFICLGTNDTKPYNWDVYGEEFLSDYFSMIDTFKLRNPNTKFIVSYPPPAFDVVWDIRDSVVVNGVIPAVDSVLSKQEAVLVDFYAPLVDSVHLFPDKIHPNASGAKVMAKIAFDKIVESDIIHQAVMGGTFVTSFETDRSEIRTNDTATLTWTSINADELYLNGTLIEDTGSKKVTPQVTTKYTLVAKGPLGQDSLSLMQLIYKPELTLLSISPARVKINEGETVDLELIYYDQNSARITDTAYSIDWSIIEGGGTLKNITNKSVTFEAGVAGVSKVQAAYGDINSVRKITIELANSINKHDKQGMAFPNPCNNVLNIPLSGNYSKNVQVNILSICGKVLLSEQLFINKKQQETSINLANLDSGAYIYILHTDERIIKGKFSKQ